ncbi:MAG TPA: glycosyltransferase family 2 protein [Gemmatimonadales bacterium]|nr:glycosyltransferase family 2 protein [Gemmatimonadales bacterium]
MGRMAVAIINWNTRDLLRACLQSAMADGAHEVIVVDNGSYDGSIDMVRREFPSVRLKVLPSNPGYGAASNIAFRLCTTEYVLLLNSDTEIRPGALAALTGALDGHPQVGIFGPKLENPDGSLQRSVFPFPSPFISLFKRQPFAFLVSRLPGLREYYPLNFSHQTQRRVPWVLGAAQAIRRTAFDAVGGFDETYVMYYEEVDLCYRMRKAGWETRFDPTGTIMHVGGASTRQRRQEMLVRLTLSSLAFHRHHDRGARLALARLVLRATARFWLTRDTLRFHLNRNTGVRERLAQDREVWREVLTRTTE